MSSKTNTVTMKGRPLKLSGETLKQGDPFPEGELTTIDLNSKSLSAYQGKIFILATVPSLDTAVCNKEARRLDEEIAKHGDKAEALVVSMDLPFAQKRWRESASIKCLETLSDHRTAEIGQRLGVLIPDLRLLARALFVVDQEGAIRHAQVVSEVTDEPNYNEALETLKQLI